MEVEADGKNRRSDEMTGSFVVRSDISELITVGVRIQ